MLSYLIDNSGLITFVLNNSVVTVHPNNYCYSSVLNAIKSGHWDKVSKLVKKTKTKQLGTHSVIFNWKDPAVKNTALFKLRELGIRNNKLVHVRNFIKKIEQNPDQDIPVQLYDFLLSNGLTITKEGNFLGYKSVFKDVSGNLYDWRTQSIRNNVGDVVAQDRDTVSKDVQICSGPGLYVGSLNYVREFNKGSNQVIILVEVNPMDVVCVPTVEKDSKCRVCEYTVVGVLEGYEDRLDSKIEGTTHAKLVDYKPKRDKYGRFCR